MTASIHPRYRVLAIATAVAVYALIIAGGVVRVSGSGLGCPDWPTCHGTMAPPFDKDITAVIEYTHRVVAAIGGAALLLTGFFAWRNYRRVRWIIVPAIAMLGLLAIQIPLGGVVVLTELEPLLVVVHLGIALLVFACALAIAVYASRPEDDESVAKGTLAQLRRLLIALGALFVVLMVGASVVGTNTGLACPEWPICNASLGVILAPSPEISPAIWYHLTHRYTVALVALWLAWVIYRSWKEQRHIPAVRLWTILLATLFVLQVSIGAVQVLLQKPAWLRAAHLGVAAGVWASLVVLTLLNYFGARPAPEQAS